jgi:hypothetical protein
MAVGDYGRDISCTTSLRTGRLSSGLVLLGEAAYRRITTPRGALRGGEDESIYGIDLLDMIGDASSRQATARLPAQIQNELLKDVRFADVQVSVTSSADGPSVSYLILISITASGGESFTLRVGVDEVSSQLLGIEPAS